MDEINLNENEAYSSLRVFKTVKNNAYGTIADQVSNTVDDQEADYATIPE